MLITNGVVTASVAAFSMPVRSGAWLNTNWAEVEAELDDIATQAATVGRKRAWPAPVNLTPTGTLSGATLRMDHPLMPTTVVSMVLGTVASGYQQTYYTRDNRTLRANATRLTEGALYIAPIATFVAALIVRKMMEFAAANSSLTTEQRARVEQDIAVVETHLATWRAADKSLMFFPESAVFVAGNGQQIAVHAGIEPTLSGLTGVTAEALTSGTNPAVSEAVLAEFNDLQASVCSVNGWDYAEIRTLLANLGAATWCNPDINTLVITPTVVYSTTYALVESYVTTVLPQICGLINYWGKQFNAGFYNNPGVVTALSKKMDALLDKLGIVERYTFDEAYTSFEEFVQDWLDGRSLAYTLAQAMGYLAICQRKLRLETDDSSMPALTAQELPLFMALRATIWLHPSHWNAEHRSRLYLVGNDLHYDLTTGKTQAKSVILTLEGTSPYREHVVPMLADADFGTEMAALVNLVYLAEEITASLTDVESVDDLRSGVAGAVLTLNVVSDRLLTSMQHFWFSATTRIVTPGIG